MSTRRAGSSARLIAALSAGTIACAAIVGADFDEPASLAVDGGAVEAATPVPDPPRDTGAVDEGELPGTAPSCAGLPRTCGATRDGDCCASTVVPGGTFERSYDGQSYPDAVAPARVREFRLDRYEVTVGRFRRFVEGYPANRPSPRTGANANNLFDPGWDPGWNDSLPADADALRASVACNGTTWTDAPGSGENRAMNCLDWFVAFAFCIWDGGRLPSEAEWNFAASGGGEHRVYPWSVPPASSAIDESHAVYTVSAAPGVRDVGSKAPGLGRWEHADLAGNVREWVLDWYNGVYVLPCNDCARTDGGASRAYRGGGFRAAPNELLSARRGNIFPVQKSDQSGVRCARGR